MSGITFNPLHSLADVTTPDGVLLGAVPNTRKGIQAGEDAISAYLCAAPDTPETVELRLRVARRVIVMARGTPNISPIRRLYEPWETTVRRHQWALGLASASRPGAREVGR